MAAGLSLALLKTNTAQPATRSIRRMIIKTDPSGHCRLNSREEGGARSQKDPSLLDGVNVTHRSCRRRVVGHIHSNS